MNEHTNIYLKKIKLKKNHITANYMVDAWIEFDYDKMAVSSFYKKAKKEISRTWAMMLRVESWERTALTDNEAKCDGATEQMIFE